MPEEPTIEVVVLDVLGTMVDEPGGIRAAIRDAAPAADDASVDQLLGVWQGHVQHEQRRMAEGVRRFANTEIIDREAAGLVADRAGPLDSMTMERLATAGQRLAPWADSIAGLTRLARQFPVIGLSNASRASLLHLNRYAGLRWHQALSAEDVAAYKPAPAVYQLAVRAAGCPPHRILMVAAHAWDLRGAQAVGLRTAYVQRPVGDPPTGNDAFDWQFDSLKALVAALRTT